MPKKSPLAVPSQETDVTCAPLGPSLDDTLQIPLPPDETARIRVAVGLPAEVPVEPRAIWIQRDGAEPLEVALYPDRTYLFGRAPEASFVLPSEKVSRLHGQLRFNEGRWIYRDLNSANGSFVVNGPVSSREDPRV